MRGSTYTRFGTLPDPGRDACDRSPTAGYPPYTFLKHITTKRGAPKTRENAITNWTKAWKDLEQVKIQAWIERIE
jgi:hypothetical protein